MTSYSKIPAPLPDDSIQPKSVDVLDEDKPIAGQKFVCVSFLSCVSIYIHCIKVRTFSIPVFAMHKKYLQILASAYFKG